MDKFKPRLTHSLVEKRAPKKNTITSTRRKTPPIQEQANNNYNSEQPIKREAGENNGDYYHRQKAENKKREQNAQKPQKSGLAERGKNYANDKINKAKEYGTQKGKEALGKGADYAKGKGKEFLDKNPKTAGAINKAREAKQNFEDRMNMFRDSAELSARKPPIKQNPGESDLEFRRRQQKEDDNAPENPQRMGLRDAAKQHAKDYGKKQLGKGADYAKRKIAASPALTSASNKIKAAKDRADAIKKRSEEIKKRIALKTEGINKRIKALKYIYNAKKLIRKKIEDEAKKILTQAIMRATAQVAAWLAGAILATIGTTGALIIFVIIIVVVIIAVIYQACNDNMLSSAVCMEISWIGQGVSWFMGLF